MTFDNMKPLFYKNGLMFECKRCGNCCSIPDGVVYLTAEDIQRLCNFLMVSEPLFLEKYTTRARNFRVLRDGVGTSCIFFDTLTRSCRVYSARPIQCRTFPFWSSNLKNENFWNSLKATCPGIDNGRIFSFEDIERIRRGETETA